MPSSRYSRVGPDKLRQILAQNYDFYGPQAPCSTPDSIDEGEALREAMRYFLYLDSERSEVFFADHVLVCEGSTEKALFEYLRENHWSDLQDRHIYFFDSLGKENIPRFIALFKALNIRFSVLFDGDNDIDRQKPFNKYIEKNMNKDRFFKFPIDLECFLGLKESRKQKQNQRKSTKRGRNPEKPLKAVCKCASGEIAIEKLNDLRRIVDKLTKAPY